MLRLVNDRWAVFQSIFWKVRAFATGATNKKYFSVLECQEIFFYVLEYVGKCAIFASGVVQKEYFRNRLRIFWKYFVWVKYEDLQVVQCTREEEADFEILWLLFEAGSLPSYTSRPDPSFWEKKSCLFCAKSSREKLQQVWINGIWNKESE